MEKEKKERILKILDVAYDAQSERANTSIKIRKLIKLLETVNNDRGYSTGCNLTDEQFIEYFEAIGPLVRILLEDEKNKIEEIKKNSGLV